MRTGQMSDPAIEHGLNVQPTVGHSQAKAAFVEAWQDSRLHHAWMLTGPQGIGKATLALQLACFVLERGRLPLEHCHTGRAASQIRSGAHPAFRRIAREVQDNGKLRKEITVEPVRSLTPFLGLSAADGGWRVILIDALEDMNRTAANALLKMLEEPPGQTLFIGTSHAPGRLLPTIRSRCRRLALQPLTDDECALVFAREQAAAPSPEDAYMLLAMAPGQPGVALKYAGLDLATLATAIDRMIDRGEAGVAVGLAAQLSVAKAQPQYEAFLDLALSRIARHATRCSGAGLAQALSVWEKARALAASAIPLALEPQLVVHDMAGLLVSLKHG